MGPGNKQGIVVDEDGGKLDRVSTEVSSWPLADAGREKGL